MEPVADDAVIWTRDLAKDYGAHRALRGLTMEVRRGEVLGFLGPNGAGKTTTVKILLGLVPASSGEGRVLGQPLGSVAARRRIGYLPELFRYQEWLGADEVLRFHMDLAGVPRAARGAEATRVLRIVGLERWRGLRVGAFSKGMTQRLGLAVALLGNPELLFLDEPTSALDPVGCHDVRGIIRQLRDQGVSVFLNSHLLAEVEQVADRVVMLDGGQATAAGTLRDILRPSGVRIRVTGLSGEALSALGGSGRVRLEDGWLVAPSVKAEDTPALVAAVVAQGGAIFAVEPIRQTLESRFLDWLGGGRAD